MTMALYLSRQLLGRILAVLASLVALGLSIDMLENATDILEAHTTTELAIYGLLRAPLILLTIVPLGVLIGATLTFLTLAVRHEMVVLRVAGCNTLRIVLMVVPFALLCGAGHSFLSGRLAPAAEQALVERFPELFDAKGFEREVWLRDWKGVIRIGRGTSDGIRLEKVSIFETGPAGELLQRIDAESAQYARDEWTLHGVTLQPAGEVRRRQDSMVWETRLTPAIILGAAHRPELVDTGEVREILAGSLPGGRGTPYYSVQLWRSYSAYLMPLVMILFGVLASFRLSRSGSGARYITLGFLGGAVFVLVDGVFTSLGEVGAMGAVWAAFLAPGLFFVIGLWSIIVVEE